LIEAHFGESAPFSIGVEEEVMILDGDTFEPVGAVDVLLRGAEAVAAQALMFAGPSRVVHPALVNGAPGVVVTIAGRAVSVMDFTVADGKVAAINALGDPDRLSRLDLAAFGG